MGNIKIGFRLIAAFVVVAALAGVVGGFGYNGLHDTKQSLDNISKMALPGFPWVADLLMSFPEGTNEGYGPIFSDSRADRALVC